MKVQYIDDLEEFGQVIDRIKELTEEYSFEEDDERHLDGSYFQFYPVFRNKAAVIEELTLFGELLNIDSINHSYGPLKSRLSPLFDPSSTYSYQDLDRSINLVEGIWEDNSEEIKEKTGRIEDKERKRLNEALHNFKEGCYYSAIAMSVTAIESRLLNGMKAESKSSKPQNYSSRDFDELMLGQIINEYEDNKGNYNNFIPEKFENIFRVANDYRIFSVHPKSVNVQKGEARSVLTNSFNLLIHEDMDY